MNKDRTLPFLQLTLSWRKEVNIPPGFLGLDWSQKTSFTFIGEGQANEDKLAHLAAQRDALIILLHHPLLCRGVCSQCQHRDSQTPCVTGFILFRRLKSWQQINQILQTFNNFLSHMKSQLSGVDSRLLLLHDACQLGFLIAGTCWDGTFFSCPLPYAVYFHECQSFQTRFKTGLCCQNQAKLAYRSFRRFGPSIWATPCNDHLQKQITFNKKKAGI